MTLVTGRRRRIRKRDIFYAPCASPAGSPTMSSADEPSLREQDAPTDPLPLFTDWYTTAAASELPEPGAMTLATATPDGIPSARIVLLRGYDERGFVFYTNYQSRKGGELAANPRAAL